MNWWNVLEVSQLSDLKTIKKAYAKLLKVYNPEDDAEGYQRLREAYDAATKYAKRSNKNQNNETQNLSNSVEKAVFLENIVGDENYDNKKIKSRVDLDADYSSNEKQDTSLNINESIREFIFKLNKIYNNISLRRNPKVWEELLNMDVVWYVYSFQIIEDKLFEFLIDNKYLPAEIWLMLKDNFNWEKNEINLYYKYPVDKVNVFFKNLKNPNKLKYDYLDSLNVEIVDEYLFIRQKAYEAFENKNYVSAQKYLLSAYDIFKEDTELLRLIGYFYYDNGHLDKALEFSRAAFDANNSDLDSAFLIGKILVESRSFNEALPYLEWCLSFNKDDGVLLNYIGYCYYYTNDLLRAKENFQILLNLQYDNKIIQKYIKNIELRLEGKSNRAIKLKKYKVKKKKIIRNEWKSQETKIFRKSLIFPFILSLVYILPIIYMFFGIHLSNADGNKNSKTKEIYENNGAFIEVKTIKDLRNVRNLSNIKVYLKNVKPIEYYKLSNAFNDKKILSKAEIEKNNLQENIESQLFLGTLDNSAIIFTDKNCNEDSLDKNNGYIMKGRLSKLDIDIFNNILAEYYSYSPHMNNLYWPFGIYID